jgi:hypothetical protein
MAAGTAGQNQAAAQNRGAVEEFRQLAMQIQQLAQKYPEIVDDAAQMLPLIQRAMSKVAGNPQRSPEKQAPPMG